ncbi:MAG: hypothetical protein OEY20_05915 [Gemmatimonadota bacterium]|nr:hypothetical protein [Gemmatimonadota bacterium]
MRARCAVLVALAACTSGAPHGLPQPASAQQPTIDQVPPAGFGTLRLDDIALLIETAELRIRVLPLDERVIRLLSPDSYESLAGLKRVKAAEIDASAQRYGVAEPVLFSVSFYGLRERAPFSPEELTLQSRGRFFRPIGFVPLSPTWGEHQLAQRANAIAIVLYESGIALFEEDLVVSYQVASTRAWRGISKVLERERSAVLSRAAAAGKQ